jgi:hypothetical protein
MLNEYPVIHISKWYLSGSLERIVNSGNDDGSL